MNLAGIVINKISQAEKESTQYPLYVDSKKKLKLIKTEIEWWFLGLEVWEMGRCWFQVQIFSYKMNKFQESNVQNGTIVNNIVLDTCNLLDCRS